MTIAVTVALIIAEIVLLRIDRNMITVVEGLHAVMMIVLVLGNENGILATDHQVDLGGAEAIPSVTNTNSNSKFLLESKNVSLRS